MEPRSDVDQMIRWRNGDKNQKSVFLNVKVLISDLSPSNFCKSLLFFFKILETRIILLNLAFQTKNLPIITFQKI